MPKKAKSKNKAKKTASRKPAGKKAAKKKTVKKKISAKKKTAGVKTSKKKTSIKKGIKKKATTKKSPRQTTIAKKNFIVEPGPPPSNIPPVEEPAANEEALGTVTHYYSHLGVAVIQINKGTLKTGDNIRLKGHTTDYTQQVESMEYEHQHVEQASAGQTVGIKIKNHAREHDIVYLLK